MWNYSPWLIAGLLGIASSSHSACLPAGKSKAELLAIKEGGFVIAEDRERNSLALALLDCLASPDPQWRDGIAYEALTTWMRERRLSKDTLKSIHARLSDRLAEKMVDRNGFRQSFAALVLAAAVAADRDTRLLTDDQFADLVETAAGYLESIRDYRGFDARAGWRHGIAHAADLLMQLAVHPRTSRQQVDRIVGALAAQVAPASGHFYIYGEPERLALPLIYIAQRGIYSADQWRAWFAGIAAIPENGSLYDSQAGLSRRHNLQALLLVLHVNVSESTDEALRATLLPTLTDALRALD